MTDLNYGHLWQPEKSHCQCGFLSKKEQESSELITLLPPNEEAYQTGLSKKCE